jgi:hypothetical protein
MENLGTSLSSGVMPIVHFYLISDTNFTYQHIMMNSHMLSCVVKRDLFAETGSTTIYAHM